jgi:hypothetical protein
MDRTCNYCSSEAAFACDCQAGQMYLCSIHTSNHLALECGKVIKRIESRLYQDFRLYCMNSKNSIIQNEKAELVAIRSKTKNALTSIDSILEEAKKKYDSLTWNSKVLNSLRKRVKKLDQVNRKTKYSFFSSVFLLFIGVFIAWIIQLNFSPYHDENAFIKSFQNCVATIKTPFGSLLLDEINESNNQIISNFHFKVEQLRQETESLLNLSDSMCLDIKDKEEDDEFKDSDLENVIKMLNKFKSIQTEPKFISLDDFKVIKVNECIYQGDTKNNFPHGKGIEMCVDKVKYIGEFEYGHRSGSGIVLYNCSEMKYSYDPASLRNRFYIGQFEADKLSFGISKNLDGTLFVGEFDGFTLKGKSVQITNNFDIFAGRWSNGPSEPFAYIWHTNEEIHLIRGEITGSWFKGDCIRIEPNYDIFMGDCNSQGIIYAGYLIKYNRELITDAVLVDSFAERKTLKTFQATWKEI